MDVKLKKNLVYIFSENLINQSDKHPAIKGRATSVHELIKSYGLLSHFQVISPNKCNYEDLREFHSSDYLGFLKLSDRGGDGANDETEEISSEEFGLGFDCPIWDGVFEYACTVAGSTVTACQQVINSPVKVALNWYGGWHHAHRDKGGGYCYVNDVVLGILALRRSFARVLYIDLDVHHGDGVEEAFETTKRVFTLSFHQHETGFYPGTGASHNCGFGSGKGYSANFPYKSGISGSVLKSYFVRLTDKIIKLYQPEVCVIQCGADAIVGDPLGGSNLTPEDLGDYIYDVLRRNLPTVVLGGGGYDFPNTSRYWTYLTALICGVFLEDDIPDDCECFLDFGPAYTLRIEPSHIKDQNSTSYLDECVSAIEDNLRKFDVGPV